MDQATILRELKVNIGSLWEIIAQKLCLAKYRVLCLFGLLIFHMKSRKTSDKKKLTEFINGLLIKRIDRSESNTLEMKLLTVKNLIEKLFDKL